MTMIEMWKSLNRSGKLLLTAGVALAIAFLVVLTHSVVESEKARAIELDHIQATAAGDQVLAAVGDTALALRQAEEVERVQGIRTAAVRLNAAAMALERSSATTSFPDEVRMVRKFAESITAAGQAAQSHLARDLMMATAPDVVRNLVRMNERSLSMWKESATASQAHIRWLTLVGLCVGLMLGGGSLFAAYLYVDMKNRIATASRSLADSQKATEEAKRAIMAKNNFLATIGHELRTPAQNILSSIQFLDLRKADPAYREAMERLKAGARQSEALMRDLTDFARIDSGKLPLRETAFNPADVLKRLIANFQNAANKKGLRINDDLKSTKVRIRSDEYRFQQIATNLISNAVKYSDKGAITVKLLYKSSASDGTVLRLVVQDEGPGIRPEFLSTIFQPFTQDDQSNTRRHDGAGMGLAIVEGLVKLLGGSIKVSSEPEQGAAFTVKLPVKLAKDDDASSAESDNGLPAWSYSIPIQYAAPAAADIPEVSVASADEGGNKTILLVDDKKELRDSVSTLLKHFGFTCICAASGEEALEIARTHVVAAILLDIMMPGMDGFTVVSRLREDPGPNKDVAIIAMSGYQESFSTPEQRDAFTAYLEKPVGYENLVPLLSELTA